MSALDWLRYQLGEEDPTATKTGLRSVLDRVLGNGDPEAAGAAQTSLAMQPAVTSFGTGLGDYSRGFKRGFETSMTGDPIPREDIANMSRPEAFGGALGGAFGYAPGSLIRGFRHGGELVEKTMQEGPLPASQVDALDMLGTSLMAAGGGGYAGEGGMVLGAGMRLPPRRRLYEYEPPPELADLPPAAIGHNMPPPEEGLLAAPAPSPKAPGPAFAPPLGVPEDALPRMGRKANREPDLGSPKNPEAIDLGEGLFVGPVSTEQWIKRNETVLENEENIKAAGRWYQEAYPTYQQYFGDKAPEMLGAWLMANQNATPGFAQLSATRALEQYINKTEGSPMAGLAHDKLATYWDAMQSGDKSKLADITTGQKIYDFIDSAAGQPTRTFYGNDPAAGMPAVSDVHTFRDTGRIDDTLHKWVRANYGDEVANKIVVDKDMSGGAGEVPYEWSADRIRQITSDLNERAWLGKSDWIPSEVQAIGWMGMSKMLGRKGQTAEQAITENVRNLSYELDFGAGAPFNTQFPDWHALPVEHKAEISKVILDHAVDFANGITGAQEFSRVAGTGGWHDWTNPSYRSRYVMSPEVAADTANIIGYLGQQTAVYESRAANSGRNLGLRVSGPGMDSDATIRELWKTLREKHPDLAIGFSPTRDAQGVPGIELTFDGGGQKMLARIEGELASTLESELTRLGVKANADFFKADTTLHGNDWTVNPDGRNYLERLSARYGPDLQRRLDDYRRSQLEPTLGRKIAEAKSRAAGGGQEQGGLLGPGEAGQAPSGLIEGEKPRRGRKSALDRLKRQLGGDELSE
jgi:hypothetical protein